MKKSDGGEPSGPEAAYKVRCFLQVGNNLMRIANAISDLDKRLSVVEKALVIKRDDHV